LTPPRPAHSILHVVQVDPLIDLAAELAATEALRGFDAVQLAAAKVSACDVLVAADARLCAAASQQGIAVVDLDREEG
jgi:predicted nucleic acid-binding protein